MRVLFAYFNPLNRFRLSVKLFFHQMQIKSSILTHIKRGVEMGRLYSVLYQISSRVVRN
jgi:hypothetical protein